MMRPFWSGAVLGLGWLLSAAAAFGQAVPPPRPDVPADLNNLVRRMAEQVRHLGADIGSDLAQQAAARNFSQEAQELAQSLDEFRAIVPDTPDTFQLRRAYASIDQTWHHLQTQLAQPGSSTPAVARAAGRVAELDAQIHQSLGLNAYPTNYFTTTRPLTGMAEVQRLAHALVDRAEALAAVVRADMVGPGGARLVQDAMNLAQAADAFHDGIDLGANPDLARNGFADVSITSEVLRKDLAALQPPPRVQDAWRTYRAAEVLLRQRLGLTLPPETLTGTALVAEGPSPVVALADQLVDQVNAFLQVFTPTAGAVPEGGAFLADVQQLQGAAAKFHDDAAQGLDPGQLAYEFRTIDLLWQRLARRTNRIARGWTGPNVQQIGKMGWTVAEIHRLLGMPGYPSVVGPVGMPPD